MTFGVGIVGSGFLGIASLGPLFLVELLGVVWLGWLGVTLVREAETETEPDRSTATTPE